MQHALSGLSNGVLVSVVAVFLGGCAESQAPLEDGEESVVDGLQQLPAEDVVDEVEFVLEGDDTGSPFGGSQELGVPRFLTLPRDGAIEVVNGWQYSHPPNGIGQPHLGIDFAAAVGTPLRASCSGVAMTSSQYSGGLGYGKFLLIRCDQTDPSGLHYFVLYGHVSAADSSLKVYPQAERANTKYSEWTPVAQGDLIGWSGMEDTSWAHVHFEVQRGAYAKNKTDPYDLYKPTTVQASSADYYPPAGAFFTGCGPNHLWSQCPPVAASACVGPASGAISGPADGAQVCGEMVKVSGWTVDPDMIQKVTIAVDTLSSCKFSQLAEHGDDGASLDLEITMDLWSCGLSDGPHTLGLWVLDECGAAVLVDAIEIDYTSLCAPDCECGSGPCCDGCSFKPAGTVCLSDVDQEYGCPWGHACGADVGVRTRDRLCSGAGASCSGDNGPWSEWETADGCAATETCAQGDPSCNAAASCQAPDDDCTSGPCCQDGQFSPPTVICGEEADVDYGCPWGTGCGEDVGVRTRDRYCSGSSATCSGALGGWSGWAVADVCASAETCTNDDPTCNSTASCVSDPCDGCGMDVSPPIGSWTASFTPNTDCSCAGDPLCHALYRAKVTGVSDNTASIRFKKTTGGGPSVPVKYWIVVADVVTPDCDDLGIYFVRKQGWWSGGELEVDVPVWPDEAACVDAPEGDYKKMFIITGGKDFETGKIWFQKEPILFTRACD